MFAFASLLHILQSLNLVIPLLRIWSFYILIWLLFSLRIRVNDIVYWSNVWCCISVFGAIFDVDRCWMCWTLLHQVMSIVYCMCMLSVQIMRRCLMPFWHFIDGTEFLALIRGRIKRKQPVVVAFCKPQGRFAHRYNRNLSRHLFGLKLLVPETEITSKLGLTRFYIDC